MISDFSWGYVFRDFKQDVLDFAKCRTARQFFSMPYFTYKTRGNVLTLTYNICNF